MFDFEFTYPQLLYLLEAAPILIFFYLFNTKNKQVTIAFAAQNYLPKTKKSFRTRTIFIPFALRLTAMCLLVIAMAKPVKTINTSTKTIDSTAVMLIQDNAYSMNARDISPDRISATKIELEDFIKQHPELEIGLISVASNSILLSPLTNDQPTVLAAVKQLKSSEFVQNATITDAIGMGIERIKNSEQKNKVIIAMSGSLNIGSLLTFEEVLLMAQQSGIRIYFVGTGSLSQAEFPTENGVQIKPVLLDEGEFTKLARNSGGEYYRATENSRLKLAFGDIAEQLSIGAGGFTKKVSEGTFPFGLFAGLILCLELILSNTFYRKTP